MARYLVTGGAGFIGSHIVERLVREGHAVRVLDDLSSGKQENIAPWKGKVELIRGDICDRAAVRKAVKDIEYISHQAAWRSVPKSMTDPIGYTQVNVVGTVTVMEEAAKAKVKRFVQASSSSVYGDTDQFPLNEGQAPRPVSPYALSKLCAEQYAKLFTKSFGLETVSLRYFNVFGPRQSLDNEYAVVVPKFIVCVLKGESPPVHGSGKQSRDFTYVDNVVDANLRAAVAPGAAGEVFNVACGEEHSVLDLLESINKILGTSVKPTFTPSRVGDVPRTKADLTKLANVLQWTPKVSFAEGLKRTIEAFKR